MDGVEMSSPDAMLRLHMRKQHLKERLRGWAFVVRRRGMVDSLRRGWRWLRLSRFASPRYCVYAAGLNAGSSFEYSVSRATNSTGLGQLETWNSKLKSVSSWLPIANFPARTAPDGRDIAEAILWNYHEFVVETRA